MAGKKVQVPVVGGLRKVIQVPTSSGGGTTIAEFGTGTISLAQLKQALNLTPSPPKPGGDAGGGTSAALIPGPGLSGGGVLVGPVPINLTAPIPAFIFEEGGGGGGDGDPGPPGQNGLTGAQGPMGPAVFFLPDDPEAALDAVPGSVGPTGSTGAGGPMGPATYLSAEDGEDGWHAIPGNPGAAGATGPQGLPGMTVWLPDEVPYEEPMLGGGAGSSSSSGGGTKTYFGAGAPSTLHNDGDLYFDTNQSPAKGYVQFTASTTPGTDTVAQTNQSSVSTGTVTVNTLVTSRIVCVVVCYEHPTAASNSVTSVNGASLGAFTKYSTFTNGSNALGSYHWIDVWFAATSGALTGEVITVTWASAIDDANTYAFGVSAVNPASPFSTGGGTGLPAQVSPTSGSGEAVTGTLTVPATNLMVAITAKATSGLPGNPTGFTQIGSGSNSGAVKWEYSTISTKGSGAGFTGTVTSSGLSNQPSGFQIMAFTPQTGSQWIAFG